MNKFILSLIITVLLISCNDQESEDLTLNLPTQANLSVNSTYNTFHFIRFNPVPYKKNNNKGYMPKIKNLATVHNGITLTDSKPGICAEGYCRERNIILAFPSVADGEAFYQQFQIDLASQIQNRFEDLSYVALNDFGFLTSPDVSTFKGFLIAEGDITNDSIFFNQYAPAAGATIDNYEGHRLWRLESGYQDCLMGNCADFHAIVGFSEYSTLNDWYYSEEYQSLIPLRNTITANDGTVLTRR